MKLSEAVIKVEEVLTRATNEYESAQELLKGFSKFPGSFEALCEYFKRNLDDADDDKVLEFIISNIGYFPVHDDELTFELDYMHYYWDVESGKWICEEADDDEDEDE